MTKEERAYNYASTRKATKLQVGEIAKHYNNGYEQVEKDLALTTEDIELLHQLFKEEEDNFAKHDEYFYAEVLHRFNESKKEK